MAIEREPSKSFQIYEDSSVLTADNVPEESLDEAKSRTAKRESGHRLPSINPEDHIMEGAEQSDIEGEEIVQDRGAAYSASDLHSSDEAVFDDEEDHSSPTTSHSDSISEFPDEAPVYEGAHSHSSYTPTKQRSPFRNPSSVRAMQLDVTPPFNHSGYMTSPLSGRHKLSTPSRSGTSRSVRSESVKKKTSPKKEYPLILLHATLLPITSPYSLELMVSVLPPYIIENYNLLKVKATETVVERGILVPHPREDYELLEERLLESLELKLPRILQCGHFHLDGEDYHSENDSYASEDGDADICDDCGRRIRDGRMGSGTGRKRWSIKIYAANGLMRSGAWAAAWREMERVDVEIEPWIPEDLRRELDMRRLEQEQAEEEERRREAEEESRREAEEAERQAHTEAPADSRYQGSISPEPQPYNKEHHQRPVSPFQAEHQDQQFLEPQPQPQPRPATSDIPTLSLPTLHHLRHLLQTTDKRNLAIAFLSILVLLLSLNPSARRSPPLSPYRYTDDIIMSGGYPAAGGSPATTAQRQQLLSPVVECLSSVGSSTATTAPIAETTDTGGTAKAKKPCPYPDEWSCSPDPPAGPPQVDGTEGGVFE